MNSLSGQPAGFVKLRASFLGIAASAILVLTAGTSFAESKGSYSIFPLGQRTGVVKLKEEYVPYKPINALPVRPELMVEGLLIITSLRDFQNTPSAVPAMAEPIMKLMLTSKPYSLREI